MASRSPGVREGLRKMGSPAEFQAEYVLLQGLYEDSDKRALSLKAMATPLLGAGLAVGLNQASIAILVATMAASIALWILEVIWKTFQYCHIARVKHIEALFRGDPGAFTEEAPFQVFESWAGEWARHYKYPRAWASIMRQPFVFLPYAVIVAAGAFGLAVASI
jgi:hypothetical protein